MDGQILEQIPIEVSSKPDRDLLAERFEKFQNDVIEYEDNQDDKIIEEKMIKIKKNINCNLYNDTMKILNEKQSL